MRIEARTLGRKSRPLNFSEFADRDFRMAERPLGEIIEFAREKKLMGELVLATYYNDIGFSHTVITGDIAVEGGKVYIANAKSEEGESTDELIPVALGEGITIEQMEKFAARYNENRDKFVIELVLLPDGSYRTLIAEFASPADRAKYNHALAVPSLLECAGVKSVRDAEKLMIRARKIRANEKTPSNRWSRFLK